MYFNEKHMLNVSGDNDANFLSFSYEERLSCLVLKEEFFPLMDEVKEFIRTLTTAGRGNVCVP